MAETLASGTITVPGFIVTWDPPAQDETDTGQRGIPLSKVQEALEAAGLPRTIARQAFSTDAFRRACRRLKKDHVIEELPEQSSETHMAFQFTPKALDEIKKQFKYDDNAASVMRVLKERGKATVTGGDEELRKHAQRLLDQAMELRTGADVTAIVKRLFEQHGRENKSVALIPMRRDGGMYFVPILGEKIIAQISVFLEHLGRGAKLHRFKIVLDQGSHGSVSVAVEAEMARLVRALHSSIDNFSETTRETTRERALEKVTAMMARVNAFRTLMEEGVLVRLQKELQRAGHRLTGAIAGDAAPAAGPQEAA